MILLYPAWVKNASLTLGDFERSQISCGSKQVSGKGG
jgi:hypothetical protein